MTDPNVQNTEDQPVPASGIVLPNDASLPLRVVRPGLYIVEKSHEVNVDFFDEKPKLDI